MWILRLLFWASFRLRMRMDEERAQKLSLRVMGWLWMLSPKRYLIRLQNLAKERGDGE